MKYSRLLHVCAQPGCREIVAGDRQYCPRHEAQHLKAWQAQKAEYRKSKLSKAIKAQRDKQYDLTERDQQAKAFYQSKQWKAVRDYVYARDNATCQVCGNVIKDTKIVDHIIPRRLMPASEQLNTKGLWLLCPADHNRKTKIEELLAAKPNGDTKLRHLDRQWWTRTLQEQQGQTKTMNEWRKQNESDKSNHT